MKLYDLSEPSDTLDHSNQEVETLVGIDLGTTNSSIGIFRNDQLELICDMDVPLVPSIVKYLEDGAVLVGRSALNDLTPGIIFKSIKRVMGKSHEESNYPYAFGVEDGGMLKFAVPGKRVTAPEISAHILAHLKKMGEEHLGEKITKAVITVPAYFDENARKATKDAAQLAGLEVARLLNEPTAAAVAYGFDNQEFGTYLVFDLGGGTFDITILKMVEGVFQVLATAGDENLGGDDFDNALLTHFIDVYGLPSQGDLLDMILRVRSIRERLSTDMEVKDTIDETHVEIARSKYDDLINPLMQKMLALMASAMKDASVTKCDITNVILVGGSTRTPLVRQSLSEYFGEEPICTIDPELTVVMGAAIQAHNLQHATNSLLLDVVPLSLCIEVADGLVERIIHRNSPLPFTRSMKFTTQKDGQTGFVVHVLQGEGETVKSCRSLAKFEMKNIPPMPAGQAKLEVVFNLDVDGLLSVKAIEELTNQVREVEVKPSHGLTEAQIKELISINA